MADLKNRITNRAEKRLKMYRASKILQNLESGRKLQFFKNFEISDCRLDLLIQMKVVRDTYLKWRKIYLSRMQVKSNVCNSVKILEKFARYYQKKLTIQTFFGIQKFKEKQDQKNLVLTKLVSRVNLAKNRAFYKLLKFSSESAFKL